MPATYVHLSGADLDRKMLEKRGLVETLNSNGKTTLNPVTCSNCNCENSPTARFCSQCGIAFFLKDAMEAEAKKKDAVKLFDMILQDEELKNAITKKLLSNSA